MNRAIISLGEFRSQKRWLGHRDKAPYSVITGKAIDWTHPNAWADHATAAVTANKNVGFAVGEGVVAIDLDDALYVDSFGEKPTRRVKPVFKPLYDLALSKGAFIEMSLSGQGLHIFILSDWAGETKTKFTQLFAPEHWTKKTGIEIYGGHAENGNARRFIATTFRTKASGNAQAISACDEVLSAALDLAERAGAKSVTAENDTTPAREPGVCDEKGVAVAPPVPSNSDSPFYTINHLAVLGADQWFASLFPGAQKRGDTWRAMTPGASRGDISINPKGIRWWKDDDVKTPVDVVMLFADPERELSAVQAMAWLAEKLRLGASTLRGLATMLARNSNDAPVDIFNEIPDTVVPWPLGTLPSELESYAECMGYELGVNDAVLALLFLIACGASVPAGIRFQPDPAKNGWIVPATAWAMVLAPSGMAKSPALDAALAPVYEMEDRWRGEHKARLKSIEDKVEKEHLQKKGAKRRVTNSSTAEGLVKLFAGQPEGMIMHADELAGAFDSLGKYNRGSQGGHSDAAVLLSAYESKSFTLDRKDEGRSVSAERAHLSLVGGVQPQVLAGMAESLGANGMLQRALIGVMTVSLYGPPCADVAGRDLYHGMVRQILRLGETGCGETLIVGTPEIGGAVIVEGNRARGMTLDDATLSDTTKGFLGKTTGHIARIALWLTIIDWAAQNYVSVEVLDDDPVELPSSVGIETFRKAARIWWQYCFPTVRNVYDGSGLSSSVVGDARHVAAYVLAREDKFAQPFGSRAFRDIRKFAGQVGTGRLFAALDYLVERRWLRVIDRQTSGAPTFAVDERIWTLFGDRAAALQGRWA